MNRKAEQKSKRDREDNNTTNEIDLNAPIEHFTQQKNICSLEEQMEYFTEIGDMLGYKTSLKKLKKN